MLTTDSIYWQPYKPSITLRDAANAVTYYAYNGITNTVTTGNSAVIPVYCRVQLGLDHQGLFEVQFDNSSLGIDTTNIKNGQKILIEVRKDSTLSVNTLIRGLIRRVGYDRGIGGKALFTVSGSSHAIRFNERITYQNREAIKTSTGALNFNDPNMKADTLLQNIINTSTENQIYDASSLATNSDVQNFIPSITIEYGEFQDAINLIEEQTGAEFFLGPGSIPIAVLRHQFQPITSGRGFILTDIQGTADNADYTCYISPNSPPNYTESKFKSDGYSNRIFSILPAETEPHDIQAIVSASGGSITAPGAVALPPVPGSIETAVKFRPTHSHFLPGDVFVNLNLVSAAAVWTTRLRIAGPDTASTPNSLSVIANIDIDKSNMTTTNSSGATYTVINIQSFKNSANTAITEFTLDTTKDYYLIFSDDNIPNNSSALSQFGNYTLTQTYTHASGLSTNSSSGTNWSVYAVAPLTPIIAFPRRRSQIFQIHDPKALNATGSGITTTGGTWIESSLPSNSAQVKTEVGMYKNLASQMYFMGRPKVQWSTMVITPPNIPILPNDPLMIVDNTLGFSTTGNQVMTATAGDMVYEFGTRGGEGNVYSSNLSLSIIPTGMANHY